jgi:hypothetical protein
MSSPPPVPEIAELLGDLETNNGVQIFLEDRQINQKHNIHV